MAVTAADNAVGARGANPISVCMLVYNHVRILEASIASVLAQQFTDFELIISDDCSRDGSWELIQQLAQRDARILPVRTPRNLGMAGNANFAVGHAKGEFIALLHHDDIYDSTLLAKWLDVARRHPSVAFVSNAYANEDRPEIDYHPFAECTPGKVALEHYLLPVWGCPVRGTALIRHDAWKAVGGIRESFGMLADVDLWMRLAARWDVGYVREPLITVRQQRPDDYPEGYVRWSWPRLRLLYEIHAQNRKEYFAEKPIRRELERARFRARVSTNELYWLAYALYKRRWDMLESADEIANEHELAPVRALRRTLTRASALLVS